MSYKMLNESFMLAFHLFHPGGFISNFHNQIYMFLIASYNYDIIKNYVL